ncbi:hypothetical protein OPV22_011626 [Ensete ventricosum]|uniref:Uncharacterized protein n=1 Tax=Ensete ventricosum TaxID=4639 RepID=A0AAV8RLW8_ENSVE|nr:hypothetical protein OPV22_011626 [Ensete ventricosum]
MYILSPNAGGGETITLSNQKTGNFVGKEIWMYETNFLFPSLYFSICAPQNIFPLFSCRRCSSLPIDTVTVPSSLDLSLESPHVGAVQFPFVSDGGAAGGLPPAPTSRRSSLPSSSRGPGERLRPWVAFGCSVIGACHKP